jgi:hypothetical protein
MSQTKSVADYKAEHRTLKVQGRLDDAARLVLSALQEHPGSPGLQRLQLADLLDLGGIDAVLGFVSELHPRQRFGPLLQLIVQACLDHGRAVEADNILSEAEDLGRMTRFIALARSR